MSYKTSYFNNLNRLNCATGKDEHLCKEPVVSLSCGHYICKSCKSPGISNKYVKCNYCNEWNESDLSERQTENQAFNSLLKDNINELFNNLYSNFELSFERLIEAIQESEESIDNQIQWAKDDVDIQVESIKIQLEKLQTRLNQELDDIKQKWKSQKTNECFHEFNQSYFENELKQLENNIKKQENLNKETLYYYEKQIKHVQEITNDLNTQTYKLEFKSCEEYLKKESAIGEICFRKFQESERTVMTKARENEYEHKYLPFDPYDLCELPNGNVIMTNYKGQAVFLYDQQMELIEVIDKINDKPIRIVGMATDGLDKVYLCDWKNHLVIKSDLELNQEASFCYQTAADTNLACFPTGLCCYNTFVFVCFLNTNNIKKFNSKLIYQTGLEVDYKPFYIKNIENIALVRPRYESTMYVYDLDNFTLLRKHEGHNGIIGASKSYFYEYYSRNELLYCYNKNGELSEIATTNGFGFCKSNDWGAICKVRSKLYLASYNNKFLIALDTKETHFDV